MIRLCPIAGMVIGAESVAVTILANHRLALEDLAATPHQQAQRLKDTGTCPSVDEFGLDYDNWAQASCRARGLAKNGSAGVQFID